MRILPYAIAVSAVLSLPCSAIDIAGAPIVIGDGAVAMELTAARELQRYGRLLCGRQAPIVAPDDAPADAVAVLVGTPRSLPAVAGAVPADLHDQGYVLAAQTGPERLVVAARTPIGVQNGVYSLLEMLGVGFYLGGDALPEMRDRLELSDTLRLQGEPSFAIRGSLPWYNFLNSPTTWDLEDHRAFFDQMAKMKMNFVGFHDYDSEPFFAYPDGGKWQHGAPAATSENYGWGTVRGMPAAQFGFGTGRYFDTAAFGSRATTDAKDADDAIIRAQCVLAQGLQYAKERGIHPCVGFELVGDPTDPAVQRQYERKIRFVLSRYPMADYFWLWQSEGLGGGSGVDPASRLAAYVERYRDDFAYLGSEERIAEGVRVMLLVRLAYGIIRQVRPELPVIVSGWGGDRWMRFSDFYIGLDKLVPPDVIFSALDNIDPSWEPNVSRAYGELSPTRQKWPIPWFESDGGGSRRDQWSNQANVKPFTDLCRDALAKGCQGLLGIHWETRGVEEVAAYLAQYAWQPSISYDQFYEGFAQRCYGSGSESAMSAIHKQLEALGPRWTGGSGQVECGGFQWFSGPGRPTPENLAALAEIRAQVEGMLGRAAPRHRERLRYLLATIDFVTHFDRAALQLDAGGPVDQLIARAEAEKAEGKVAESRATAAEAWRQIAECGLEEAVRAYAQRLTSQGDFGNLATINVKAYAMLERIKERLAKLMPEPEAGPPRGALPSPQLAMRYPAGVVPQGVPLPVRCTAFSDGGRVRVTLRYRAPGRAYTAVAMQPTVGCGFAATIPGSAIGAEGIEFYIEARDGVAPPARLPLSAPGTPFTCTAHPYPGPTVYAPVPVTDVAFGQPEARKPLALECVAISGVEYDPLAGFIDTSGTGRPATEGLYHVLRTQLPALPVPAGSRRAVGTALDGTERSGRSDTTVLAETAGAPEGVTHLAADASTPFAVHLTWQPGAAGQRVRYEVHRGAEGARPSAQTLLGDTALTEFIDTTPPLGQRVAYAVIPVDAAGRSGPAGECAVDAPAPPLLPAVSGVKAVSGPGRAVVSFDALPDRGVVGYRVQRQAGTEWTNAAGATPLRGTSLVVAPLEAGKRERFRVVAVDRAGRDGAPSEPVTVAASAAPIEPVFATSFDGTPAATGQTGALQGAARVVDGCLDTREGGWIAFANEDALQLGGPLSFELWVQPSSLEGIPVFLSYGHWDGLGYWLQYIGGKLRYYLPRQQILDAGSIAIGEWSHIAAVFTGAEQILYVNGQEVGRRAVPALDAQPWPGELRIGQYSDIDAQFQARALIDDVRIYQRPLSAEEVRASYERGRQ